MMFNRLLRWTGQGCAVLALIGTLGADDPLMTRSPEIRIPFNIDGSSPAGGYAALFASRDGGQMSLIQKVPASAREFEFKGQTDGRYKLEIHPMDSSGRVTTGPDEQVSTLEIIVDQTAPRLELRLTEIASGRLNLAWRCNDPGVAPGSLRLEYAEGADGRWKPVQTKPSASGQTVIEVQPGTSVEIRGSIMDLAGNQGTGSARTVMSQSLSAPPSLAGGLSIPRNSKTAAPNPFGPSPFKSPGSQPSSKVAYPSGNGTTRPTSTMTNNLIPHMPPVSSNVASSQVSQYSPPAQTMYSDNSGMFGQDNYVQPAASVGGYVSHGTGHVAGAPRQSLFSQATSTGGIDHPGSHSGFDTNTTPAVASPQIVNDPVFQIDYQIDDVGPSGVSEVQLFVTEDNGVSWHLYGADPDRRTPFHVDTRGQGTFGFAVRAKNGLGFSQTPPQPGEQPSIVVTVDRSAPRLQFNVPEVVVHAGGRILLSWRIVEPNPSPSPVRLEYSTSPSGPWKPVFDWQTDQGRYEMPIQSGMPPMMHFRLLARDAAGNVSASQTNQPVVIDQRRPRARLLRVQSGPQNHGI